MRVRTMTRADLETVLGWARDEGWNPGLDDAPAFLAADPGGFLLGAVEGEAVAAVSVVRHAPDVGFLGLYLCRPGWRGRGFGLALWRAGMARLEGACVGLDGVVAQQANYRRSGFVLAHRNIRWAGLADPARLAAAAGVRVVAATADHMAALVAHDAAITGYARPRFLASWLAPAPTRRAMVALGEDGAIRGYGAIRACVEGAKIGPLYADAPAVAAALTRRLLTDAPPTGAPLTGAPLSGAPLGPVALDAPEPNAEAAALAQALGLSPSFETARMWRGAAPREDLSRVFGVASFELG